MNQKISFICCLFMLMLPLNAQQRMLQNVELTNVAPQGWLRLMMNNQEENFTGKLDLIGFPFTQGGWGGKPFLRQKNGVLSGFWVPYEQTGYYYDGMLRCGLLLHSTELIEKSRKAIYQSIEQASEEGIIASVISQGDMRRWPHAVFFRAWMAEYEASRNPQILAGLEKHFRNDTVIYQGRDICNIETVAWLYQMTNDQFYYDWVMRFKELLFTDGGDAENIIYHFADSDRQEVHAVTFHELLKIPILFYELTGEKQYLRIAHNAFDKLDRYHMLPDGVASSEEGLSGKTSQNTHEMCNVVDYMWTCAYMLRATCEPEWADRIEKALFNAGMGGITKNFDAHQYYSCPNQVVCADHSSIVSTYEASRLAYRQIHRPPCCTGNLNRMFPIYVGNQWLRKKDGALYKMMFGPGEVKHRIKDKEVVLREESSYPFGDTVRIRVVSGELKFPLHIRIPAWCESPTLQLNGEKLKGVKPNHFYTIEKNFKIGDCIEIILPKRGNYKKWGYESMTVSYGPLLFALPVRSHTQWGDVYTPKLQTKAYKGYTLMASSDWNYILGVSGEQDSSIQIIETPVAPEQNPWLQSPVRIRVPAYKDPAWKLGYQKIEMPSGDEIFVPVTPALPARGSMIYALNNLKPELIELVPYGSTLLRISMFPFWKQGEIPAEVLATENK